MTATLQILFLLNLLLAWIPTLLAADDHEAHLAAIRLDNLKAAVVVEDETQILHVQPKMQVRLRLTGLYLHKVSEVLFTTNTSDVQHECALADIPIIDKLGFLEQNSETILVSLRFPDISDEHLDYHICFRGEDNTTSFSFQGRDMYKLVRVTHETPHYILPLPLQITLIACLFILSGCFSGLNLGLMSLSTMELKVFMKAGTKREQHYARKIYPIRSQGNFLLCSILFGNVTVNSAISILMDDLTSGIVALIVSSLGIVILSEIFPQAMCSRYGLACGAYTIWLTRVFMVLTFPLSWPFGKFLDLCFGEDVGTVYDKRHLLELIRITKESQPGADSHEVAIVTGALELSSKVVRDIMTRLDDVFMISAGSLLDAKTVQAIVQSGYTRIPLFEVDEGEEKGARSPIIVGLLNVKDLALLDPDDAIPVRTICQFYSHKVRFVLDDTPLAVMLDEFKKGQYHLAFVQRIAERDDRDPTYELVGIVTLEDVIEEIIQSEINDETDVVSDNRLRIARNPFEVQRSKELSNFILDGTEGATVSPQIAVAAYQYLSASLPPMGAKFISPNVLQRLIKTNILRASPGDEASLPRSKRARGARSIPTDVFLYEATKSADYFVLILNGNAEVRMGAEDFVFEAGPFFYFGKQVLECMAEMAPRLSVRAPTEGANDDAAEVTKQVAFQPDFTVRVTADIVYMKVRAVQYLQAYRATLIERMGNGVSRRKVTAASLTAAVDVTDVKIARTASLMDPTQREVNARVLIDDGTDRASTRLRIKSEGASNAVKIADGSSADRPVGFVRPSTTKRQTIEASPPAWASDDAASLHACMSGERSIPPVGAVTPEALSDDAAAAVSRADSFVSMDFGRTSSELALETDELKEMNAMVFEKRLRMVNRSESTPSA